MHKTGHEDIFGRPGFGADIQLMTPLMRARLAPTERAAIIGTATINFDDNSIGEQPRASWPMAHWEIELNIVETVYDILADFTQALENYDDASWGEGAEVSEGP